MERKGRRKPHGAAGGQRAKLAIAVAGVGLAALALATPAHWSACLLIFLALALVLFFPGRRRPVDPGDEGDGEVRRVWPSRGMKAVGEAIREPALIVDRTGLLRYRNPAAAIAFGNMALGDPLSLRFRQPEFTAKLDEAVSHDISQTVTIEDRRPHDRTWRVEILPIPPHHTEKPRFFLLLFHDRTQEVRVERMRTDFVANASHELRTPLSSLTGFIETLQGPAREDAVAREKFLGIMRDQALRMSRLIDDLLSLSRIEMKRHVASTASADLVGVMRKVASQIAPVAREEGMEIVLKDIGEDDHALVHGEEDELLQVFSNLVENACKYAASGGRVEMSIARVTEYGEARIDGIVRDFGEGIPDEHLPRLTERFYRVSVGGSRAKQGTGLGLAIARNLLLRCGGRLLVDSRVGEGSTFTARLPDAASHMFQSAKAKSKQIDKVSY